MDRAYFKDYKGYSIYYVDYTNLETEQEFMSVLDFTNHFRKEFIEVKELKSQLMLVNLKDSFVLGSVFTRLKESGRLAKPYLKKQAVVGVSGAKKTFLNIYNLFTSSIMKAFDTEKEALEWLIKDD